MAQISFHYVLCILFAIPVLVMCGNAHTHKEHPCGTSGGQTLCGVGAYASGNHMPVIVARRALKGPVPKGKEDSKGRKPGRNTQEHDDNRKDNKKGPPKPTPAAKDAPPQRQSKLAAANADCQCKAKQKQAAAIAASVVIQTDCVGNIQAAAEAVVGAVSGGTEAYAMGLSVGLASTEPGGVVKAFAASLTMATTTSQITALASGFAIAIATVSPDYYSTSDMTVETLLYDMAQSMDTIAMTSGCNAVNKMAISFMYALAKVDAQSIGNYATFANQTATNYTLMTDTFMAGILSQGTIPYCPFVKKLQKKNWDAITAKEAAKIGSTVDGPELPDGVGMGRIRRRMFSPCAQSMRTASALSVSIVRIAAPLDADGYCYPTIPNTNLTASAMVVTAKNGNCAFASAVSQALAQGVPPENLANSLQVSVMKACTTSQQQTYQLASSFAAAFADINPSSQGPYANAVAVAIEGAVRVLGCGSIDGGIQYFVEGVYDNLVTFSASYGPTLCTAFSSQPGLRQCMKVGNYTLPGCAKPARKLLR